MDSFNHQVKGPFELKPVTESLVIDDDDDYDASNSSHTADSFKRPEMKRLDRGQLIRLTIGMGGLQVVWATVMATGSPYLLSLGLSSSVVSLVWLAGPISGTFVQPYVGYRSDACTHRWGRRKPFIVYGMIWTIVFINLLAWASEITASVCYLLLVSPTDPLPTMFKQSLAIFLVWLLNIAIQPVQAGLRALAVDACPANQQVQASSYSSCIVILGSIFGYGCGYLEIPSGPAWMDDAQFKGLCLIASIAFGGTIAVTCVSTREHVKSHCYQEPRNLRHIYGDIIGTARSLPRPIKMACVVQFFSWLAWFPFLFYTALYLSKLYEFKVLSINIREPSSAVYDAFHVESIRHGTLGMLLSSIVALVSILTIPYFVLQRNLSASTNEDIELEKVDRKERQQRNSPAASLKSHGLTLSRLWMLSHVLMCICLLGATVSPGFITPIVFVALLGVSWALTQWIPYAVIGAQIAHDDHAQHKTDSESLLRTASLHSSTTSPAGAGSRAGSSSQDDTASARVDRQDENYVMSNVTTVNLRSRAATIISVHNGAIATPQMVSAVVSSIIFWAFSCGRAMEVEALAWVLRVGICSAAAAAFFTKEL